MIRKFRSVEDMNEAQRPVLETDPQRLFERVRDLYRLADAMGCRGCFKGVHRFRTMEESNAFRVQWMRERAERMRLQSPVPGD